MEYTEQEIISRDHEVDSPLPPPHEIQQQQQQQESKQPQPPPPIGRQGSVYSLTLDEFQNTMCENGKSFGSMNMDEFLNNIWTAEEQAAHAHAASAMPPAANQLPSSSLPLLHNTRCNTEDVDHKGILKHQHSLTRQGSISIPVPLSRKTVDEVWSEIHRSQQDQQHNTSTSDMQQDDNDNNHNNPEADSTQQQRQLTFGEMTLEDFLVRAGVVREQAQLTPLTAAVPQQTYASPSSLYPNTNPALMGTSTFVPTMPVMGGTLGGGGSAVNIAPYQPILQPRPIVVGGGEIPSSHHGAVKRGTGVLYPHHHLHQNTAEAAAPPPVCYGGRMGNGNEGAGYAQVTPLAAVASPVSPVSSDPLMTNQGDGTSYDGMDISGFRGGGRKRIMDGPIEKVVERRQRRMIKNRESAARSRARKQAYTVELEAELNQLKEENAHLKQIIKDLDRKRIQQNEQMKEMRLSAETTSKAQKAGGRLRTLRRTTSYP